jgi:hypothetical protein
MKQTVNRRMMTTGVSLLALALVASAATAQGRGRCLKPNGVDDTAELQAALDACAGGSSGCTVRLCDGVFLTEPLRVGHFRGTLRGAGAGDTIIRELYLEIPDLY